MTPARRLPRPFLRCGLASVALTLAAVLVAPLPAVTEEPGTTTWEELRSEEGKLIVWMPGKATYTEVPGNAPGVVLHTWLLKREDGVIIAVSWSDVAKAEDAASVVPDVVLEACKKGFLSSLKINKATTEKSTVSGCPALLVTSDPGERIDMTTRIVQAGIRTYQVAVAGARGKVDASLCRKVLESFKVLDERKIVGMKKEKEPEKDDESLTEEDK